MAPEEVVAEPIVTDIANADKVKWYKKRNLTLMYFFLFCCCMGVETTSGFDSQLINVLQFSKKWNKYFSNGGHDKDGNPTLTPAMLGFVSACYQLGSIFGVPLAPWTNQKFGRRWNVMGGSIIMVVGSIIQGFSQDLGMYIFSRMLLGFGIVFCIISGSSLIGELGHPKDRDTLTSLFNASYFIGAIIAAAIALKTSDIKDDWSWRIPSLLQMCPSILQISTVFLLPESPRYLISKDRHAEAHAILTKYHAEGNENSELVKAEMAQISATIKIEMENSSQSWMNMINTPGMRRRTLLGVFIGLFTQMSGNTLISYYQSILFTDMGFTTNYAKTRINIASQCWGLMVSVSMALVVARFRRRVMFMASTVGMTLVFLAMTVCFYYLQVATKHKTTNHTAGTVALFWYFAYTPAYNLGNNALTYTYLIELFPYHVRTRGIGIEQVTSKIGAFFSNNVNPIAMNAIGWKFLAIYCGWLGFECLFVWFLYPETHGRTLEELSFLFEEKDLAEQAVLHTEKGLYADNMDKTNEVQHAENIKGPLHSEDKV